MNLIQATSSFKVVPTPLAAPSRLIAGAWSRQAHSVFSSQPQVLAPLTGSLRIIGDLGRLIATPVGGHLPLALVVEGQLRRNRGREEVELGELTWSRPHPSQLGWLEWHCETVCRPKSGGRYDVTLRALANFKTRTVRLKTVQLGYRDPPYDVVATFSTEPFRLEP